MTITTAVKGSCTTGVSGRSGNGLRPGGTPPAGWGRPSGGGGFNLANFGVAFGKVTAVKGTKVKVKGTRGSTPVTLSKET